MSEDDRIDIKLGPTGDHPEGSIHDSDEGGLTMAIGAIPEKGVVVIQFGTPISWLGLPKDQAKELGESLIARSEELP